MIFCRVLNYELTNDTVYDAIKHACKHWLINLKIEIDRWCEKCIQPRNKTLVYTLDLLKMIRYERNLWTFNDDYIKWNKKIKFKFFEKISSL